jgi:hypothetical protein
LNPDTIDAAGGPALLDARFPAQRLFDLGELSIFPGERLAALLEEGKTE